MQGDPCGLEFNFPNHKQNCIQTIRICTNIPTPCIQSSSRSITISNFWGSWSYLPPAKRALLLSKLTTT